jgi:hypothetical protein
VNGSELWYNTVRGVDMKEKIRRRVICQDCSQGFDSVISPSTARIKGYEVKYCPSCRAKYMGKRRTEMRFIDSHGYVQVRLESQRDDMNGWYIPEHRLVMEQILRRRLVRGEIVHHKDGNRQNNQPDNLELFVKHGHPNGVRASDLVCPHCDKPYI